MWAWTYLWPSGSAARHQCWSLPIGRAHTHNLTFTWSVVSIIGRDGVHSPISRATRRCLHAVLLRLHAVELLVRRRRGTVLCEPERVHLHTGRLDHANSFIYTHTLLFKSLGSPRQVGVFHENSLLFIRWIAKWIYNLVKTLTRL